MIDHVVLPVHSISASTEFYTEILKPLNYTVYLALDTIAGFKTSDGLPDFWIAPEKLPQLPVIHIAFRADGKKMIDEFHANALKAGAKCNGPPDYRPQYGKGYYAAYITDLDGHNIEAKFIET